MGPERIAKSSLVTNRHRTFAPGGGWRSRRFRRLRQAGSAEATSRRQTSASPYSGLRHPNLLLPGQPAIRLSTEPYYVLKDCLRLQIRHSQVTGDERSVPTLKHKCKFDGDRYHKLGITNIRQRHRTQRAPRDAIPRILPLLSQTKPTGWSVDRSRCPPGRSYYGRATTQSPLVRHPPSRSPADAPHSPSLPDPATPSKTPARSFRCRPGPPGSSVPAPYNPLVSPRSQHC
jgi:hypothetical protein